LSTSFAESAVGHTFCFWQDVSRHGGNINDTQRQLNTVFWH